jgi:hypothetical protein
VIVPGEGDMGDRGGVRVPKVRRGSLGPAPSGRVLTNPRRTDRLTA